MSFSSPSSGTVIASNARMEDSREPSGPAQVARTYPGVQRAVCREHPENNSIRSVLRGLFGLQVFDSIEQLFSGEGELVPDQIVPSDTRAMCQHVTGSNGVVELVMENRMAGTDSRTGVSQLSVLGVKGSFFS
jgi:hypothetical protein